MQFLYPSFLTALLVLALPIIIHLFYFRRFKKVYFTNVRFLKEVKDETSARSKLKHLLVLLSRLLALAFLVLAFAQPFIPQADAVVKKGEKAISVFIDNSFSMQAESQDVPLIDKAKQRAREIINAFEVTDRFQIITHDFEGRHQQLLSQEDARSLIDEISITPAVRPLSSVFSRQLQALEGSETTSGYLYQISDFQKSISDLPTNIDTTIDKNLVLLQAVQERNIAIDSAWFESPVQMLQQNNRMLIKVSNYNTNDAENIRLSYEQDGQNKPIGTLNIPAQSSVLDTVNISVLTPGWHQIILKINDYPVTFDDTYFTTFQVAELVNILVVNEIQPNAYLTAALSGLPVFQTTNQNVRNIDYASFDNYQLIVLNELSNLSSGLSFELKQYVENGGNLLVFPSVGANITGYNTFLNGFPANELVSYEQQKREVGQINTEEFIFNDVFENERENLQLPVTQGNFKLSTYSNRKEERILVYRDGRTYLGKYQLGQGHLYMCAAPLNQEVNNLVENAEIFIPLIYKAAISSGTRKPIAFTIGKDEIIEINHQRTTNESVYQVVGNAVDFIPRQRIVVSKALLTIGDQIKSAGYYDLKLGDNRSVAQLAFNFDRQESDLSYFTADELTQQTNGEYNIIEVSDSAILTSKIEARSQGTVLWKWCILLMLFFLAVETLLLRFWKT